MLYNEDLTNLCVETFQSRLLPEETTWKIPQNPSEEELKEFLRKHLGVTIPDVQVCPNHTTPWRAFLDAFYAKYPVSIWHSSRGFGGKSYLLAALGMAEAILLKTSVNIMGGSGNQSRMVHDYMTQFWNWPNAPRELLASDPTLWHTNLTTGNKITALTATQKAARGPHIPRLRMDEIDEMELATLDAALGQPMEMKGVQEQTVLSSTHQNPFGTMTEILERADKNDWPIYQWCYRESQANGLGWLTEEQTERKKRQVTKNMWEIEYELQMGSPEDLAIMFEKVKLMFDDTLGIFDGELGEYIEIEGPRENAQYATGADWAKEAHFTSIITFRVDTKPMKLVAYERRHREAWPRMIGRFNKRVWRYPGKAAHDATGIGNVIDDYIEVDADGIEMRGKARYELFSNYIVGIENEEITAPDIKSVRKEYQSVKTKDLYGSGHPPDTIVAGAMAYYASLQYQISTWDDVSELGQVKDYVSPWA